jgi:hypothetical protein
LSVSDTKKSAANHDAAASASLPSSMCSGTLCPVNRGYGPNDEFYPDPTMCGVSPPARAAARDAAAAAGGTPKVAGASALR